MSNLERIKELIKNLPNIQRHFHTHIIYGGGIELERVDSSRWLVSVVKIRITKTKANFYHSAGQIYMKVFNDVSEREQFEYYFDTKHDLTFLLNSLDDNIGRSSQKEGMEEE